MCPYEATPYIKREFQLGPSLLNMVPIQHSAVCESFGFTDQCLAHYKILIDLNLETSSRH